MRTLAVACFALLGMTSTLAQDVYVRPHVTKDGTYVAGHMRTAPNDTRADNYSTQGNVNPYTLQPGTKPLYPTSTYTPSYSSTYAPPKTSTNPYTYTNPYEYKP